MESRINGIPPKRDGFPDFWKGVIMKFPQTVFVVKTAVKKDSDPIVTTITLTESDIPDETVAGALISGQSPRVAWQTWARTNGIPNTKTLSWADWIGKPAPVAKPMTYEQIVDVAKSDPEKARKLLAELQAMFQPEPPKPGNKK